MRDQEKKDKAAGPCKHRGVKPDAVRTALVGLGRFLLPSEMRKAVCGGGVHPLHAAGMSPRNTGRGQGRVKTRP